MFRYILSPFVLLALTICTPQSTETPWIVVSRDPLLTISGMAMLSESPDRVSFVVVHDNKNSAEPRAGILAVSRSDSVVYSALAWPDPQDIPNDLEAIAKVPKKIAGNGDEFVALTAGGRLFHFRVDESGKQLVPLSSKSFKILDERKDEFEALDLFMVKESLFAVWATRAEGGKAAVYWRELKLADHSWGSVQAPVKDIPPPEKFGEKVKMDKVRAISDLRVSASGEVFVSSASDESNAGPFSSVVHRIGRFSDGKFLIEPPSAPSVHRRVKIEAIEFVPNHSDKLALATDDENCGALFHLEWKPKL